MTTSYASFAPRLWAALIDATIAGTIGFLGWVVFLAITNNGNIAWWFTDREQLINNLILFALLFIDSSTVAAIPSLIALNLPALPNDAILMTGVQLGLGFVSFNWLYHAISESSPAQATVGKRLLKLKVTDLEGARVPFLKATARHFAKILSTLTLMCGYLMILKNSQKQALHDKLANCLIVVVAE